MSNQFRQHSISEIELHESVDTRASDGTGASVQGAVYQQLKPADRGFHAWKVLTAAFLFEALLWGFPICFGVFQEHYSHLPEFQGKNVALIGTIAQGLCYLGAPISLTVAKRFQKYQRHLIWFGWLLCILSLVAGSLTSNLVGLIATQGVMYGFGFITLYWPIMSIVNEWWITRKGFAFGLIMSAGGASGAVFPFIFETLLAHYGYKTTLKATAVAMVLLTGPLIPFVKGRLPPSEQSALAKMDWRFSRSPLFWVYMLSTVVQGLGLFFPAVFLPSYATDIGMSKIMGALLLSVMAIFQFCGQCVFGFLSDKHYCSVTTLALTCSVMAALASFLLWGFGTSLPLLLPFGALFGFFGYGFSSMRSAMARKITVDPTTTVALQSILNASLGWGVILVGPISARLLHGTARVGAYGAERYDRLVYFSGGCMIGSALLLALPALRLRK